MERAGPRIWLHRSGDSAHLHRQYVNICLIYGKMMCVRLSAKSGCMTAIPWVGESLAWWDVRSSDKSISEEAPDKMTARVDDMTTVKLTT